MFLPCQSPKAAYCHRVNSHREIIRPASQSLPKLFREISQLVGSRFHFYIAILLVNKVEALYDFIEFDPSILQLLLSLAAQIILSDVKEVSYIYDHSNSTKHIIPIA